MVFDEFDLPFDSSMQAQQSGNPKLSGLGRRKLGGYWRNGGPVIEGPQSLNRGRITHEEFARKKVAAAADRNQPNSLNSPTHACPTFTQLYPSFFPKLDL